MADAGDPLERERREVLGEPVGPRDRQDRVGVSPEHERRDLDAQRPGGGVALGRPHALERLVVREAAAERARLRIGVDPMVELPLYDPVFLARPVGEEVAQVDPGRLAARSDHLVRPRQRVKDLVPDLPRVAGLAPQRPMPG